MKKILCAGALLCLIGCKRYTCECSTTNQQAKSEDAYQVSARDKSEALTKCQNKHDKNSIGTKKAYCVIR
ncbi:MAG: hypothetical protein H0W61_00070 [Bacteroidetes bacterium]|nr:hypothetical protein [Bacteroidota bacterium]